MMMQVADIDVHVTKRVHIVYTKYFTRSILHFNQINI